MIRKNMTKYYKGSTKYNICYDFFIEKQNAIYLAGHRPVENKYNLRQNGLFVQFHNPCEQNIAIIYNNRPFNPEEDIIGVEK